LEMYTRQNNRKMKVSIAVSIPLSLFPYLIRPLIDPANTNYFE